jgi:hypothetical protein
MRMRTLQQRWIPAAKEMSVEEGIGSLRGREFFFLACFENRLPVKLLGPRVAAKI